MAVYIKDESSAAVRRYWLCSEHHLDTRDNYKNMAQTWLVEVFRANAPKSVAIKCVWGDCEEQALFHATYIPMVTL